MACDEITTKEQIEAYAKALFDIMLEVGAYNGNSKIYDPLTIHPDENCCTAEKQTRQVAHTYVFDLRDGGRHHDQGAGWTDLEDLREQMLKQAAQLIQHHIRHSWAK